MFLESLTGLVPFTLYFGVSLCALLIFKILYTLITPHDEWDLVKKDNSAAAIALSGTLVGYAIALGGAASNSVDLLDFGVWAVVALIAQLLAYGLVRFAFLRRIAKRIERGELAAGIILAGLSIAIGILNAACMTW